MKVLVAVLLFAGVALAQEAPVQKIVPVKNGNIHQIFPPCATHEGHGSGGRGL